jgi:hypothetical protein
MGFKGIALGRGLFEESAKYSNGTSLTHDVRVNNGYETATTLFSSE